MYHWHYTNGCTLLSYTSGKLRPLEPLGPSEQNRRLTTLATHASNSWGERREGGGGGREEGYLNSGAVKSNDLIDLPRALCKLVLYFVALLAEYFKKYTVMLV